MILLNGKRIDSTVGDALPIGTLSPFVGLVAPKGYLICMGQLVDKAKYPELWELCGDTFGPSTATQFYLPDLRGQTIAGYKQGDSTFGTLGALIGGKTTSYTPAGTNSGGSVGNHTLTVAEMPAHGHGVEDSCDSGVSVTPRNALSSFNNGNKSGWGTGNPHFIRDTGGGGAHNHGFTNPTFTGTQANISTVQPTAVMNWVIKASMIAVIESNIEDSLTSTSATDALSARQGKLLNDKFDNYYLKSGGSISGQVSLLKTSYQCNSGAIPGTKEVTATNLDTVMANVRYSNGLMGSFNLETAYTKDSITIARGWYNYLYIPHRIGGLNGGAQGDNASYGNLLIFGMTVSGAYIVRWVNQAINSIYKIY